MGRVLKEIGMQNREPETLKMQRERGMKGGRDRGREMSRKEERKIQTER